MKFFSPDPGLRFLTSFIAMACGLALVVSEARAASLPAAELFSDDRITRIEVEVSPADMEDLASTQKFKGMGERKSYNVTVHEGGRSYSRVAMHLKGAIGSFRSIDKNPALTLTFDKNLPNQHFHGLRKISLNNSVQDPTFVSERISRELFRRAGIPSPRVGLATIKLNGRDLGVYTLIEGYNRQFLKQHFADPDGNLYDGGLGEEIHNDGEQPVNSGRKPKDQSRLKQLVEAAREPDFSTRLTQLEGVLDLNQFVTLTAMDVMICNWDGYAMGRNNYRMFHDLKTDRLIFLPHGLDQTFQNPEANILPRMPGLVARALLEMPEGRRRYLDRMAQLGDQFLQVTALTNRVEKLAATIEKELTAHDQKVAKEYGPAVANYCRNIAQRATSVQRQLQGARAPVHFDASGAAPVRGWASTSEFGQADFGTNTTTDGMLRIRAEQGATIAAWRSKVWLERGHYRFEGRVKTVGLEPAPSDPRGGAGLRSANRPLTERTRGDQDWKAVQFEFEVMDPLYEVQLVCEFRALRGEALFDRDSLRVVKLASD